MATTRDNAQRLLRLFEEMRHERPAPAFIKVAELNLSFSHLRTLHLLLPDRALPMKELAEQLGMTPPSITALTRRLVETGLVERHSHPRDQRMALLSLTGEGRQLMEQLYQGQLRGIELLLQGLAPGEQELFISLMERAVRAMRAEQSGEPAPSALA